MGSREAIAAAVGVTLLAGAWRLVSPGPAVRVGSRGPTLTLPLVANGRGARALSAPERVTVVEFFASWCGACAAAVPELDREMARRKVRFIFVSVDENSNLARAAARRWKLIGPVAWDRGRRAATAYGVQALPTLIVTDPEGTVAATHVGPLSESALAADIRATGGR